MMHKKSMQFNQPSFLAQVQGHEKAPFIKTESFPIPSGYTICRDSRRVRNSLQILFRNGPQDIYRQVIWIKSKPHISDINKKKNSSRKRKNSSDDDYNVKNQKKDRNVTSNIIHHLFKFLLTSTQIDLAVSKIITQNNLTLNNKEFNQIIQKDDKNLKTYVTAKHIKELWFSQDPIRQQYCQIMRILSKYFFCKHGFVSIYSSNKFNKVSKINHYKGLRTMMCYLSKRHFEELP